MRTLLLCRLQAVFALIRSVYFALSVILLLNASLGAVDIEWSGGTQNDYSNPNSWDPAQVPGALDNVRIPLVDGVARQVDFDRDEFAADVVLFLSSGFGGELVLHSELGLHSWMIDNLAVPTFGVLELDELELEVANTIDLSGQLTVRRSSQLVADVDVQTSGAALRGELYFDVDHDLVFGHSITGPGDVRKSGSNQLTLTASNGFSGTTIIEQGTLVVPDGTLLGSQEMLIGAATLRLVGSGSLSNTPGISFQKSGGLFEMASDQAISYLIASGSGNTVTRTVPGDGWLTVGWGEFPGVIEDGLGRMSLQKTGSSSLTLTGSNTYTGTTTVVDGSLVVENETNLGPTPGTFIADHLTLAGGTLGLTFSAPAITTISPNRGVTLTANGTFEVPDLKTLEVRSVVAGPGGLTKSGRGTLMLSGDNTYAGDLAVNEGVVIGNVGSIRGNLTLAGLAGLHFDQENDAIYDSSIDGTGFELKKLGPGRLTLTGTSEFTARTIIEAGTVVIDGTGSIAQSSDISVAGGSTFLVRSSADVIGDDVSLQIGGTLDLRSDETVGGIFDGFPMDNPVITRGSSGSSTLTVRSGFYSGVIEDGAGEMRLVKTGPLQLSLSGINTYSGATQVDGGELIIRAEENFGMTPAVFVPDQLVFNGGSLKLATTSATISENRGVLLKADTTFEQIVNGALTINSVISGTGDLIEASGRLRLGANNVHTGRTIARGTIEISSESALGPVPDSFVPDQLIIGSGGALSVESLVTLSANRGVVLEGPFNSSVRFRGVAPVLYVESVMSGNGGLQLSGSTDGQLILRGDNAYAGPTAIYGGELQLDASQRVPDTSSFIVGPSGKFDLNNFDETIDAVDDAGNGGGMITLGTGVLTVGATGGDGDFSGTISGTGSLIKEGAGTQMLSGANSYTGGTVVNEGVLVVDSSVASATGSGPVVVADGGTLRGIGSIPGDITVQAGGTLEPGSSPGRMTVGNVALESGGSFQFEVGGTSPATGYDQLSPSGIVSLAGMLRVQVIDGFEAVALNTDVFHVVAGARPQVVGAFQNVASGTRLNVEGGLGSFQVDYGANGPFGDDLVVLSKFRFPAVSVTWAGGTGDWSDFRQWNPTIVPKNNGVNGYNATVLGGVATVDAPISLEALFVKGGKVIVAPSQSLTTEKRIAIANGEVEVSSGAHPSQAGVLSTREGFGENIIVSPGGTLTLTGGRVKTTSLFIEPGATLQGVGNVVAFVDSQGTLAPGVSTGTLTVNDLTMRPTSNLVVEIGGTSPAVDYGVLDVVNVAAIDGILNVDLINGFRTAISSGDAFSILRNSGPVVGQFVNVANGDRVDTIDGSGSFQVHYGASSAMDPNVVVLSDFLLPVKTASWLGGRTNWSASNWSFDPADASDPDYPSDVGMQSYDTLVSSGDVILDLDVDVDTLTFSGDANVVGIGTTLTVTSGLSVDPSVTANFEPTLAGPGHLTVEGGGRLTLFGDNTFSGGTTVWGTLSIKNAGGSATGRGDIHVKHRGHLGGIGTVQGHVVVENGGTLGPGASAGQLTVENDVMFEAGSTFQVELGGLVRGSEYDYLEVTGNAILNGALSVALIDQFEPGRSEVYDVMSVRDTLSGEFAGLAEGARVGHFGGRKLYITYSGGDGNDVALFSRAYECDLNLDDAVDAADASVLFTNWGTAGPSDITGDGTVDAADASVCFTEWTGDSTHAVPEPAMTMMSMICVLGLLAALRPVNT